MPNTVIKNIPQYLNLDADERYLQKNEMPDALNVRALRASESSQGGVLQNVKGTVEVALASAEAEVAGEELTCIGYTEHAELNNAYFFVHSSLSNHRIYQYNTIRNTAKLVLKNSVLNFSKSGLITDARAITKPDGETLLYFTDYINPPRKINVEKAILHTDGDYTEGYPSVIEDVHINVIKRPPSTSPTFLFVDDKDVNYNNLKESAFQFQYRYIYDDGERSAYSPISGIAVAPTQSQNFALSNDVSNNVANALDVTVINGEQTVEKIEVIARDGNGDDWFLVKTLDNITNASTQTFRFYNDGVYSSVSTVEQNKLFDNVPIVAKALTIKDNRLFFGNHLEGYDAEEVENYTLHPRYADAPEVVEMAKSATSGSPYVTPYGNAVDITVEFTLPNPEEGQTYYVELRFTGASLGFSSSVKYDAQYIVKPADTKTIVGNALANIFLSYTNNFQKNGVAIKNAYYLGGKLYIIVQELIFIGIYPVTWNNTVNGYVVPSNSSNLSFKAGSKHPIGIVYYDRDGRSTTVSKLGDGVYVEWFSERDNQKRGHASIDWRLGHTPPIWAYTYQFVYGGNTTVDTFLQYYVGEAYDAQNVSFGGYDADDKLYISLRPFKGKEDSYINQYGATNIDYVPQEGDKIRIKSYYDPTEGARVYPTDIIEFDIVDYHTFGENNDNPIYDSSGGATSKYRTTGNFVSIKKPTITGWSTDSQTTGFWFNVTNNEAAEVEIYRRKPAFQNQLYYEFSEEFAILNPATSSRAHEGGLRNQGEAVTKSIEEINASGNWIEIDNGSTTPKLVVGDTVTFSGGANPPVGTFTIINITFNSSNGFWRLYLDGNITTSFIGDVNDIVLYETWAAGTFENGDVWFKPRLLRRIGSTTGYNTYRIGFVEDYQFNDKYPSASWNKGRPNAFSSDSKQTRYKTGVTYSDTFANDSNINGLSSFNSALLNFTNLDRTFGSIQSLKSRESDVVIFFENKTGRLPISRSVIESADGGETITLSRSVIDIDIPYIGDYGVCFNPESIAKRDGMYYFIDIKRGKVLRLSNDGLTPISEYGISRYMANQSRTYTGLYDRVRILGGYDRENEEYIFTIKDITERQLSVDGSAINFDIKDVTEDSTGIFIPVTVELGKKEKNVLWDTEDRNWDVICENWDVWGSIYTELDILQNNSKIGIRWTTYFQDSTPDILVKITDGYFAFGYVDVKNSRIVLPKSQGCSPNTFTLSIGTASTTTGFTLAYYELANKWTTFYSFSPEYYGMLNNDFFGFVSGRMWKHNVNSTHCNFYSTQYGSRFASVFNEAPSAVKVYRTVGIEGDDAWDVALTTNLNTTTMDASGFSELEGFWYQSLPFAKTSNTESPYLGLGEIDGIAGSVVTITGYNQVGIQVGDTVYKNGSSVGTITAIGLNTITLSSVVGLNTGDFIYVQKSFSTDGDNIRGYYMKGVFTLTSTSRTEVFAVNTWINESKFSYS